MLTTALTKLDRRYMRRSHRIKILKTQLVVTPTYSKWIRAGVVNPDSNMAVHRGLGRWIRHELFVVLMAITVSSSISLAAKRKLGKQYNNKLNLF